MIPRSGPSVEAVALTNDEVTSRVPADGCQHANRSPDGQECPGVSGGAATLVSDMGLARGRTRHRMSAQAWASRMRVLSSLATREVDRQVDEGPALLYRPDNRYRYQIEVGVHQPGADNDRQHLGKGEPDRGDIQRGEVPESYVGQEHAGHQR